MVRGERGGAAAPAPQPPAPSHPPSPLPPDKVSVVLMNYSRPRMVQESTLMRTLLSHPSVDEIVLLHSNPATAFHFLHPKVVNVDSAGQNDEMGLSLRFYFCQLARNPWIIHVDDDMEFELGTLSDLLTEFARNPRRIVGRYGRDTVDARGVLVQRVQLPQHPPLDRGGPDQAHGHGEGDLRGVLRVRPPRLGGRRPERRRGAAVER